MDIVIETNDIFQKIKTKHPRIIGIDGIDDVGKTSLAKDVEKYGYKRITLDGYVKKKRGEYFKFVDFDRLTKAIKQFTNESIVIEGVLLKKIFEKLSLTPNYLIYVTDNVWVYDWLEEYQGRFCNKTLSEIIKIVEKEVALVNAFSNQSAKPYKMDEFRKEIYEYSYKYKPWKTADIILVKK